MRTFKRLTLTVVAGFMLATAACQEAGAPTGPDLGHELTDSTPERSDGLLSGLLGRKSDKEQQGGEEVEVLRRTESLESDEFARARVGLLGATLRLPQAGLTVLVPPGAAPLGTRITVRAPAGDLVGYHFEPHGLSFNLPVVLIQGLAGTEAEDDLLQPMVAAYFEGELSPLLTALEILPLRVHLGLGGQAIFEISHFSGYIVATN